MNENETVQIHKAENGQTANASAGGSTSQVRGDGSATLEKLRDREARAAKKLAQVQIEVEKQVARVQERRERHNQAAARAAAAVSSHAQAAQ